MSVDEAVTKDLIETLEDGRKGFAKGADQLDGSDAPDLAKVFRDLSEQRAAFSSELRGMAQSYGDAIDESGSVVATLHRGWLRALVQRQSVGVRAAHAQVRSLRAARS